MLHPPLIERLGRGAESYYLCFILMKTPLALILAACASMLTPTAHADTAVAIAADYRQKAETALTKVNDRPLPTPSSHDPRTRPQRRPSKQIPIRRAH